MVLCLLNLILNFMPWGLITQDEEKLLRTIWKLPYVGCPMFILKQKLKKLKVALKFWRVKIFGNVHKNSEQALSTLDNVHHSTQQLAYTNELIETPFSRRFV